jgi:hypothetical protein
MLCKKICLYNFSILVTSDLLKTRKNTLAPKYDPMNLFSLLISIRARCTVCQWLATGRWFSQGAPVSTTNKTYRLDITEILLKVISNTINQTHLILKYVFNRSYFPSDLIQSYIYMFHRSYFPLMQAKGSLSYKVQWK